MRNFYLRGKRILALAMLLMLFCKAGFAQTYYFGGTGTWTGAVWSTTNAAPYTTAWVTNKPAVFNIPSSTITGATTNFSSLTANEDVVVTPGGTLGTGGTVATITVASGKTLDFAGQNFSTTAGTGFIKDGAGTMSSSNGNAYPGGFTLNNGTIILGGTLALGGGGTNPLNINGGVLAASAARSLPAGRHSVINIGGDFTFGNSTNNSNIAFNDPVSLGSATRTITIAGTGTYTLGGIISGAGGLLLPAASAGTLTLSGTNTYTGVTTVNGGTLSITVLADGGIGSSVGAGTVAASNLVLGGGTLLYTGGTTGTTNKDFTLTGGTTSTLSVSAASNVYLNGAAAATTGALTKSGTGLLVLGGENQYTGITTVTAGTIRIGASERIHDQSTLTVNAGASFDLNAYNETVGALSGSGIISRSIAADTSILTVGGNNTSTVFSGVIQNGSGTVSFVKAGSGTLSFSSNNTYTGYTTVNNGTLQLNAGSGVTIPATNTVNVNNGGTLQVSQSQTLANVTLGAGSSLVVDASRTLTITGTLTVNTGATVSGTIAYSGAGALVYTGTTSITAGTEWPTSSAPNTININTGATVVLAGNRTTTTALNVNGALDAVTYQVTGSGALNVNGRVITSNTAGFAGGGTTFTGAVITLGASSTVEYNAASGTQAISTSPSYANLTLSNGGTRTTSNALNIASTLTISGTVTFDAVNRTIGSGATNIVMTGTSRYKMSGSGSTKPDAAGTYTLDPASTMEFSQLNGTQENIRLGYAYANIEISGNNVGLSGNTSSLTLQTGSIFTVKSTGTFNVQSTYGLNGASNTAITNTNGTAVVLESGSTINYNGTGAQTITNVAPYENLVLSGSGDKTAPTSILYIYKNLTLATTTAVFKHNNGTVEFTPLPPAAQTYTAAAGGNMDFYNFINLNTNAGGLIIAGDMSVANILTFNFGSVTNLSTGNITLKSTAAKTAEVPDIATSVINYTGTGRFIIERYLFARKAWRFLATPVQAAASPSVFDSWQEAGSLTGTGFGTQITGPSGSGLDAATAGYSMKKYDMATDGFIPVNNTAGAIAADRGYFVFVRGDRSVGTAGGPAATTLRIKGEMFTGDKTISVSPNKFESFGNPYPSRIDFYLVPKNTVVDGFTTWNPNAVGANGVGAYETYIAQGNTYAKIPLVSGITKQYIESGEAVFIQSITGGSITLKENTKGSGSSNVSFTGGNNGITEPTLNVNLYAKDASGTAYLADGALLNFDNGYSNAADNLDMRKIMNTADNIAIVKDSRLLAAERRPLIQGADTIFLSLTGTRVSSYSMEVNGSDIGAGGVQAYLKDRFTNTSTPLSLTGTTVPFDITDAAASKAADRFMIVFRPAVVVPVTFTEIKATRQADQSVLVKWNTANELSIDHYEIERSANATAFNTIANKNAVSNNGGNAAYTAHDLSPLGGTGYYRVKAVSLSGQVQHTNVVKAAAEKAAGISVNPNPVKDREIRMFVNNMPEGKYTVSVINAGGQSVYTGNFTVKGTTLQQIISLNKNIASGNYKLIVVSESGDRKLVSVFIQ